MDNFAAIDFETANTSRSSICSIGVVIVRSGMVIDKIYELVRPLPNYYTYWNTRVHGLTQYDTNQAMSFPEAWQKIQPRIQGLPLVAHNSVFDEGCLKKVYEAYGLVYPAYHFFCTMKTARKKLPELVNHKLDTVASFCGYDLTNHHNALADAEACAAIALKLL